MSGTITDLPLRVCPSCKALFVQDDRMYEDASVCPRCGSDLDASLRAGGGGAVRTVFYGAVLLATEAGAILTTEAGKGLIKEPLSRWG